MGTETVCPRASGNTFGACCGLSMDGLLLLAGAALGLNSGDNRSLVIQTFDLAGVNIASASEHLLELLLGSSWKVPKCLVALTLALKNRSSNPASEIR